jgi:hypothetical protein
VQERQARENGRVEQDTMDGGDKQLKKDGRKAGIQEAVEKIERVWAIRMLEKVAAVLLFLLCMHPLQLNVHSLDFRSDVLQCGERGDEKRC